MDGYSDMLASFHRHGLSRDDLFVESVIQITAGSDTSATGLRSIMLYLIAHPRVYRKLQAEIDNAVALGTIAAGAIAQDSSLRKLPYLQAVIREGVRMHPPIASVIPKLVPKGGDTVTVEGTSYFLPGGTHVSYNAWGVHRNKAVFGDDADQFRPERWLMEEMDGEKMAAMRRTTELVFGYGKYQCLGKSIAWMEMSKTIFEVSVLSNILLNGQI
jgi:cytochrome P450